MADDMIILTRTFDLLSWLLPKSEQFPRLYRSTVTRRLMDAALDVQEALFDAHSQGGSTRQRHLRAADAGLNKLRLYLRCASVEVDQRRPVRAREPARRRDRAAPRRLAPSVPGRRVLRKKVKRPQGRSEHPGGRLGSVCARRGRYRRPCGRDAPAPFLDLRLGPRTLVGGQFQKPARACAGRADSLPGATLHRRWSLRRGTDMRDVRATTRKPFSLFRLSG